MSTQLVGPGETQQFETSLALFKKQAQAIEVTDKESCLVAKTMQRDVRDYMKDIHAKLDPFVNSAKRNLQVARDELSKWIDPAEAVDSTLGTKVKTYEQNERLAAQREQDRINEENRRKAKEEADAKAKKAKEDADFDRAVKVAEIKKKLKNKEIGKREAAKLLREAGDYAEAMKEEAEARAEEEKNKPVAEVQVKPNIPTVSGVPTSRRPWRWAATDLRKIPDDFWILDDLKINAIVRNDKDKTNIPGIRVFQEP